MMGCKFHCFPSHHGTQVETCDQQFSQVAGHCTSYMLVIVSAYPQRTLQLRKYRQIISRAESKFKGLAWLAYDEQFRCHAADDLTLSWDLVDLELWTINFSGLAKPRCFICSSLYHISHCKRQQTALQKGDQPLRAHELMGEI